MKEPFLTSLANLKNKNNELIEQMENYIMNKLDLDEYNLTSDDFRSSGSEKPLNKSADEVNMPKKRQKANATAGHPLVPKLNFQKIFDWREKQNNDNVIMIRISESRIVGEDIISEEINDEDGIEQKNKKYFSKGNILSISSTRNNELFDRKQMIINALNQAYTDEGDSEVNHDDTENETI